MTRYATIFGFGLFDESNLKYKKYLDRFITFVDKKKIDTVILCGGHSNLKMPEKSEAGTMADYLKKSLNPKVKMIIEDQSLDAEQHFISSKNYIDLGSGNSVFIVSDSVRFLKYYWMFMKHWFGLSKDEISAEWLKIATEAYQNPKKKAINLEIKDMKRLLKYKNVKIVIDPLHKNLKMRSRP